MATLKLYPSEDGYIEYGIQEEDFTDFVDNVSVSDIGDASGYIYRYFVAFDLSPLESLPTETVITNASVGLYQESNSWTPAVSMHQSAWDAPLDADDWDEIDDEEDTIQPDASMGFKEWEIATLSLLEANEVRFAFKTSETSTESIKVYGIDNQQSSQPYLEIWYVTGDPELADPTAANVTDTSLDPRVTVSNIWIGTLTCVLVPATPGLSEPSKQQILEYKDESGAPALAFRTLALTHDGEKTFSTIGGLLDGRDYGLAFAHPDIDDPVYYIATTTGLGVLDPNVTHYGEFKYTVSSFGTWWHWVYPYMRTLTLGGDIHAVMVAYEDRPSVAQILLGHGGDDEVYYMPSPAEGPQAFHRVLEDVIEDDPRSETQFLPGPGNLSSFFGGWSFAMAPVTPGSHFTVAMAHIAYGRSTVVYIDLEALQKN